MKKELISSIALLTFAFSFHSSFAADMMDANKAEMMQEEMTIVDVTAGKVLRSITTSADAGGYAKAYY